MRHACDFSNPRGLMRTTLLEIQAHKWQGQVGAFMLLSMFCKAYASSTVRQGRRPNVAFCILLGSARSAALVVGKGEVIFNSLKGKGAILVTFGKGRLSLNFHSPLDIAVYFQHH